MLNLSPPTVSLEELEQVYRSRTSVRLDRSRCQSVEAAARMVASAASAEVPVYGVNTGFGKLSSVKIASSDTATLQRNLIRSHCAGVGDPLPDAVVRLALALKLVSLGRGASGVRWSVIELIEAFIAHDIVPVVPGQGSVGASGDLAPLAHITAALMGEGNVSYKGAVTPAADVLGSVGVEPLHLGAKEGLALINGTQVSTALALAALFDTWRCCSDAIVVSALSTEAIMGSTYWISESQGNSIQVSWLTSVIKVSTTGRPSGLAYTVAKWALGIIFLAILAVAPVSTRNVTAWPLISPSAT